MFGSVRSFRQDKFALHAANQAPLHRDALHSWFNKLDEGYKIFMRAQVLVL